MSEGLDGIAADLDGVAASLARMGPDPRILVGDCRERMAGLPACSVDAVVCDPPYGLEFMGKDWDAPWKQDTRQPGDATFHVPDGTPWAGGVRHGFAGSYGGNGTAALRAFQAWSEEWATEALRVLKPGGHLVAFGGTRTWHRLACAIEDAGFEVRDSLCWLYGSGFPKSLDVGKAIDKAERGVPQGAADPTSPNHGNYRTTKTEGKRWDGDSGQGYGAGGSRFLADGMGSGSATARAASGGAATAGDAERWDGWGTALKPAFEPIVLARKPLAGTVAANVLEHGTGALNIDGCRIDTDERPLRISHTGDTPGKTCYGQGINGGSEAAGSTALGRWPANVVLDEEAGDMLDAQTGVLVSGLMEPHHADNGKAPGIYGAMPGGGGRSSYGDQGGASRFFYCAKAAADERPEVAGVRHPTVKPLALIRWLVRLVTPPGGTVLDPFLGSGTTAEAALLEGFDWIGCELCDGQDGRPDYVALIQARLDRFAAGRSPGLPPPRPARVQVEGQASLFG